MKKKILISTGGSGGHVFPAIAFFDHLKKNFEVFLVSDKRGYNFINKDKYKCKIINSPRLKFSFLKLPEILILFISSFFKSFFFLKKNKVDILLGTGGYMSVPICIAANLLDIKIYLFEPNMVIGRANKFLIRFSRRIFCYSDKILNFPDKYKNKLVIVNRLLRKEIYYFNNFDKEKIDNNFNILILGGSQGAKFFDYNFKNSIVDIAKKHNLKVFHQISKSDFNDLNFFYKKHGIENKLFNFEENIFQYIKEANLAITRAGASTLSELAFLEVPFIAIPYKFATDNHQLENAMNYQKNECCWILKEDEFNQNKLTTLLLSIIENDKEYLEKKKNLEKFSYKNNWNNINEQLIKYLDEN